jgi:hypothetical protein
MIRNNRCFFTFQVLVTLAVLGLIVSPVPAVLFADNASPSAKDPPASMVLVVTGTTDHATVIRIQAAKPCLPVIRYSNISWFAESGMYDHEVTGIRACTSQIISLTSLEPGTRYHYQVSGCGSEEKDRSFTTFPQTGNCSFVVYGDSREQEPLYTQTERHKMVADRIANEKDIRFVVNSGDLVAESDNSAEWTRFFNSTENLRSDTAYFGVPGNHDQDRVRFQDLFGMAGPYSFDCGNSRILLLDSTDNASKNLTEQAGLVWDSFGHFSGAKIAILHYPPYSSDVKHFGGWENLQKTLVPAFHKTGVQLVFSSHVHAFEQVEREGITYITEARGGAPAYPLNTTRVPGSVRAFTNTLGYSRVTVDPGQGTIVIEVVQVADVSPDLRTITTIYPAGTTEARIVIPFRNLHSGFPDIADVMRHPVLT